ncbi:MULTISPECIES: hypothetical protein [unclassified Mucilaginibacter]|uniref:hypothetical protein n=1 Tax=unclassified Mucilaginibacter TaxID=2617802 RepID=UPI00138CBA70|nr:MULTISPECIES: hypothetical protein [unclassified Mucilaginibacter]MBB5394770.1 hypothetical protein [Mucilaginibacter sp. AK015]QHS56853.1 hypothetical protein GWR56_15355 [Mucilaginibacter sp. 14171R-50]
MENYPITISKDKQIHHFEVGEYLHHDEMSCKFKIFEAGKFVASFEPDAQQCLHICQNPGNLDEEILHLLADQIEAHHPHQRYH